MVANNPGGGGGGGGGYIFFTTPCFGEERGGIKIALNIVKI